MSGSQIVKLKADTFLDGVAAQPTVAPIGDPVSQIRSRSIDVGIGRSGIWASSPGRWHRQVLDAEYCIFLEGECEFIPQDGDPITIVAGDVVFFPARSDGVWDIKAACRKAFLVIK